MRRSSVWLALVLAVASSSVLAGPGNDRSRGRDDSGQSGRPFSHQSAAERQQAPNYQRDAPQREEQRQQRLSPEERRQLRSDIRDAGREIYPQRR
jgi:hypothetical protein